MIGARRHGARKQAKFPQTERERSQEERQHEIKRAERQERRQKLFPLKLRKADEHGGLDDAEAAWRMADRPEERGCQEDDQHCYDCLLYTSRCV